MSKSSIRRVFSVVSSVLIFNLFNWLTRGFPVSFVERLAFIIGGIVLFTVYLMLLTTILVSGESASTVARRGIMVLGSGNLVVSVILAFSGFYGVSLLCGAITLMAFLLVIYHPVSDLAERLVSRFAVSEGEEQ